MMLGGLNYESHNLNASSELTVAVALLGFASPIPALRLLQSIAPGDRIALLVL